MVKNVVRTGLLVMLLLICLTISVRSAFAAGQTPPPTQTGTVVMNSDTSVTYTSMSGTVINIPSNFFLLEQPTVSLEFAADGQLQPTLLDYGQRTSNPLTEFQSTVAVPNGIINYIPVSDTEGALLEFYYYNNHAPFTMPVTGSNIMLNTSNGVYQVTLGQDSTGSTVIVGVQQAITKSFTVQGFGTGQVAVIETPAQITATIYPPNGLMSPFPVEQSPYDSPNTNFSFELDLDIGQNGFVCNVSLSVNSDGSVSNPTVTYV